MAAARRWNSISSDTSVAAVGVVGLVLRNGETRAAVRQKQRDEEGKVQLNGLLRLVQGGVSNGQAGVGELPDCLSQFYFFP
jgi:hypothetical protein